MEIKYLSPDELIPYENNPRHNQASIEHVMRSLREFGFRQPIVVDERMIVVVGHTRLEAAKRLGMKEVPVHVAANMTEAQLKAYRILDNRSGEFSKWDQDKLLIEIDEIQGLDPTFTEKFLAFEIEDLSEEIEAQNWDYSEVEDESIITIKVPAYVQDDVIIALNNLGVDDYNIQNVKKPKGAGGAKDQGGDGQDTNSKKGKQQRKPKGGA